MSGEKKLREFAIVFYTKRLPTEISLNRKETIKIGIWKILERRKKSSQSIKNNKYNGLCFSS